MKLQKFFIRHFCQIAKVKVRDKIVAVLKHHEDVWKSEGKVSCTLHWYKMEVSGQLHAQAALLSTQ
jgi:hypothetical protein